MNAVSTAPDPRLFSAQLRLSAGCSGCRGVGSGSARRTARQSIYRAQSGCSRSNSADLNQQRARLMLLSGSNCRSGGTRRRAASGLDSRRRCGSRRSLLGLLLLRRLLLGWLRRVGSGVLLVGFCWLQRSFARIGSRALRSCADVLVRLRRGLLVLLGRCLLIKCRRFRIRLV